VRIAFYHKVSRQWDGRTPEREPLGGTQTAIIGLSRALAQLGHEVAVFGSPPQPGTIDGVLYQPASVLPSYLNKSPVDALVSTVNLELFRFGVKAPLHLFWAHNDYGHFTQGQAADLHAQVAAMLAGKAAKVVAVSEWHAEWLRTTFQLPTDHVWATRNGIDPSTLPARAPGIPAPRLIYTSVPDRGLDDLLRWFPRIRAVVPAAELFILSSFSTWGMAEAWTMAREAPIRALADQPGVTWLDPVAKPDLLRHLGQARLLAYPCHSSPGTNFFAETSCLAAIEAQAMGVPVVASETGALAETVRPDHGGLIIPGQTDAPGFDQRFADGIVRLLTDDGEWSRLSDGAARRMREDYDWQRIATAWVEAIAGWQQAAPTALAQAPFAPRFPAPKVTIIIPTYNRAENLQHCLDSLALQDHPAFEVLICDDGSTDGTRDLVIAYGDRLNLQYLWQPHDGFRAGAARNMGLKQARGTFTILLDSDLIVPTTFVSAHVAALEAEPAIGVNSYVYRTSGPVDVSGVAYEELGEALKDVLIADHRDRYNLFDRPDAVEEAYFLDSNAISFRTKDLIALQGFDEAFVGWGHEDTDLGYRMGARGFKLRLLKDGAVAYHLFHAVGENKEAEQQANWARMREKWQLDTFYQPLGHLPVEVTGQRSDDPWPVQVRIDLKTSQALRFLPPFIHLDVADGILQAIRWVQPGDVPPSSGWQLSATAGTVAPETD
jgi:GT2 family glycosyltransferase/glycosyltransferase involved in cell wall biosynthesis